MIRDATLDDADRIAEIYRPYITETIITFEQTVVSTHEFRQRMSETTGRGFPWLVIEDGGEVCGYAYADLWRKRVAYRHSVEAAVYVDRQRSQRGMGTRLYEALLDRLRQLGSIHVVVGGIALPNEPSVRLHQKLGFESVGVHRQVGRKFGQWVDVHFFQLRLPIDNRKLAQMEHDDGDASD